MVVFAARCIYFVVPVQSHPRSNRRAFLRGYGHYPVFASAAATGAGLEVAGEQTAGKAHISTPVVATGETPATHAAARDSAPATPTG